MIAPLRRRHRLMFTALALGVTPLLAASLLWRSQPVSQTFPVTAGPSDPPRLIVNLGADSQGFPGQLDIHGKGVVLRLHEPLRKPDVLAYWSAQGAAAGRALPGDVHLLGSVSAQRDNYLPLPLWPASSRVDEGFLILYSLGHHEVVASAAVPALGGAPESAPTAAAGDGPSAEQVGGRP